MRLPCYLCVSPAIFVNHVIDFQKTWYGMLRYGFATGAHPKLVRFTIPCQVTTIWRTREFAILGGGGGAQLVLVPVMKYGKMSLKYIILFGYVRRTNKMYTASIDDLIQLYCLRHVSNNRVRHQEDCTSSFTVFYHTSI
jgi:hypothetical protein